MENWFKKWFEKPLDPIAFDCLKTDMHSHFIPAIDDGAATLEESINMIKILHELGYQKVITTPHVMNDFYNNTSETILGNQSLAFRNPAINNLNEDTLTHLSFSNVKWLGNIVDDMGFNYVGVKKGKLDYSLLYFNYGEQNLADESGIISGNFSFSKNWT